MGKTGHIKVLHLASGDLWAGAEVQLLTLAKELQNAPDITAEVILLNHGKLENELRNAGVRITVFDEKQLNGISILFRLISLFRETSPHIIHTHRQKENILGSIAAYFSGKIPTLRTVHGAPEHIPSWRQLPKKLIRLADWSCGRFLQKRIISVSDNLSGLLEKSFPSRMIRTIENGIDINTVSTSKNSQKQAGTFSVGIAGRLVAVKRVDIAIKTAQYLLNHYPELKVNFHIYGDGPLRRNLEQLSKELKTDSVVFFEGHCDNLNEELQRLDALLMTSDHEGLPMVLLEAMACKTPIIAHATGGIPVLLDHGRCGTLITNNEASEYAHSIKAFAADDSNYTASVNNALSRVTEHYSSQANARKYCEEYRSIIGNL
jgi:glycosyltransferase involved in cell wall biosynthesis